MKIKVKKFILTCLLLLGLFLFPVNSYAYNVNAAHPGVNKNLSSSELNAVKKRVWDLFRSRGWSEEMTAGAMGNIEGESSYNWTTIEKGSNGEGNVWDWSWVRWVPPRPGKDPGRHGFGLCQWTYSTRQDGLLQVCDAAGKQWTDLSCQLKWLSMELDGGYEKKMATEGGFSSVDEMKKCKDIEKATYLFRKIFEGPSIPHDARRIASAKAAYNQFKGSSISSSLEDLPSAKIEKYIFVGDSRTHALEGVASSSDCVFSYKDGEGYNWMQSTGVPNIESQVSSNTAVIFWMGVNDGSNNGQAGKYAEYVNKKASEWSGKGASVFYVSVGPVDRDPYINNSQIESFNSTLKSALSGVTFIDIYSDIKSMGDKLTVDGIHYTTEINKKIFDLIKSKIDSMFTSSNSGSVTINSRMIVDEWDLLGMPERSLILDNAVTPSLATRDNLTVTEVYSVQKIKENVELSRQANKITTVRVLVVFIGLLLVFYSILLFVSILFDKANNWFDFSLVRVLTFGAVTYTEEYGGERIKGYSTGKRLIFVCVVILCVGLFLVSGGLFSFMYNVITTVGDFLSNWG